MKTLAQRRQAIPTNAKKDNMAALSHKERTDNVIEGERHEKGTVKALLGYM